MNYSELFKKALKNKDINLLKTVPKSDLHNHGTLGGPFQEYKTWSGYDIPPPPTEFGDFSDFISYINTELAIPYAHKTICALSAEVEFLLGSAFRQAKKDGVSVLEMSIDALLILSYDTDPEKFANMLQSAHKAYAPDIVYRPEIGMNRKCNNSEIKKYMYPLIETGFFSSIDLYGNERLGELKRFKKVFKKAKSAGMKCKAHAGELLDAEFVRKSAEILELDSVQHGIAAAESKEVMKWLSENNIQLNVCPASNIKLKRAENYETHPIRILYDNGIDVTVNTDDYLIFNSSVSEEYMKLYEHKVFNENELDDIRLKGLK